MGFAKGKELEHNLMELHRLYSARGWGAVCKAPEPVVITGRRGAKVWGRLSKQYWTDFFGYLKSRHGTIPVAGEAKESHNDHGFRWSEVSDHQAQVLERTHHDGGVGWLWIRKMDGKVDHLILAPEFALEAASVRSTTWEDLSKYQVKLHQGWYKRATESAIRRGIWKRV
jgi:penicillin-binding protein-related factor A (putative recombinase)